MVQNKKQIIHHAVFALVFILLIFGDRITKNFAITSLRQDDITIIRCIYITLFRKSGCSMGNFSECYMVFCHNYDCCPWCNDIFLQQNTGTKEISAASIYHYPFGSWGNR